MLQKNIPKTLKNKKLLLANWGCGDKETFQCRDWIPFFEKWFGKLIVFSLRNYYYFHGKEALNKKFLEIIKIEKPDYLIFGHRYDEIRIDTLKKIKELSPKTKTIIEFGDDDFRFDDWSRYYALFFDYVATGIKDTSVYKKEGIKNVSSIIAINPDFFKPMNVPKKYDVSFIGRPIADRYDYIKFLMEKKVDIKLFGAGWSDYPDLKKIYKGVLYSHDFPKTINRTKINLNFSKTLYEKGKLGQFKGRVLEVPACKSFLLTEYTEKNLDFVNEKKELNFRNKEELLEKIKYYLKNEMERERIAEETYNYILKNWTWDIFFKKFFERAEKDKPEKKKLPKLNKKMICFSEKEINLPLTAIKEKLKEIDYVYFKKEKCKNIRYREYFQAYSLYISKKKISCCDYYVHSKNLGDYLLFKAKESFNNLDKKDLYNLLNINQIMIDKNYFLKHIDKFRGLFNQSSFQHELSNIMNYENIVFVSIPLIRIEKSPSMDYSLIKKSFYILPRDTIIYMLHQKNFLGIIKILKESLFGKFFIIQHLLESSFKFKDNLNLFKSLR